MMTISSSPILMDAKSQEYQTDNLKDKYNKEITSAILSKMTFSRVDSVDLEDLAVLGEAWE
jgi:hypothetical protein